MNLNIHPPLPAKKDFRIGILGSGFIVNDCHLVSYRKAGFNPVAIASRSPENAIKVGMRHGIPKTYVTYEQLLDDPCIEVLDIAVPPNAQLALIKAACERKTVKGILAQKPLGMNYAEALEAVECCEKAGITLAVNQNMRYDQSVRAAKTLLTNGTIGEPVFASIDMRGVPHFMPWQEELGWVTLRIMSIHHLDCLRYWFGDPEGIYCSTRTDPRTKFPHTDGICTCILEYANGLRCVVIDDIWTGPVREGCPGDISIKWRIEGLNGLALGDIGWCKDPHTSPSSIRFATKGDAIFREPRWTESWFPDAFAGTMAQLLIALETGQEPAISGRDNLKTMALVDAAYLSASQFRSIGIAEIENSNDLQRKAHSTKNPEATGKTLSALQTGSDLTQGGAKPPGFFRKLVSKFEPRGPSGPDSQPLSNFTPRAQQALTFARKEADRLNHNFVGTEHLLLGLIRLGLGVAVNVLKKMGLDLENIRLEVEKQVGTGPDQKPFRRIPYTPRVKRVLALAAEQGKALNHTYVGTEHILLGLLVEGDGVAGRVLKTFGVEFEKTRSEILKELDPFPTLQSPGTVRTEPAADIPQGSIPQSRQEPETVGRLTPRAQQVLGHARREADRLNHNFVSAEHLLLGLLKLGNGVAVNVLLKRGVSLELTREKVEQLAGKGAEPNAGGNIPYTKDLKKALALAAREATALNFSYVGTEHLLLGLMRGGNESLAVRALTEMGVDLELTRQEILNEIDPDHRP